MPGEFHLTGTAGQLMLGTPTAQQLAALTGLQIVLKSNIPTNRGIPTSGGLFYVGWRTVTVLPSGQISEDGTNPGIMLLANDSALNLTSPVQWTVVPGSATLGGKTIKLSTWTFQAPAPGVARSLDQLAPVPNITAVPVGTLGIDQITGFSTVGLALSTAADAATARAYLGDEALRLGVQVVPAATGVAATDAANILAAHTALPATGGDILLQGGTYALPAAGVTFTKPQVRLIGVGGWGDATYFGATQLFCNAANATALTIGGGGCVVENLMIVNSGGINPTSGYGIKMTDGSEARINHVWVHNFYDNIRIEDSVKGSWKIYDSYVGAPVRYGLFCANPSQPDIGDALVHGTTFDPQGSSRTASVSAAIHWESGGGFRLAHSKINGAGSSAGAQFAVGVDFAMANGIGTSDLFVTDNSIENCGAICVRFQRLGAGGTVNLAHVQDNEFLGTTTDSIVDFGAGFDDLRFDGNTVRADAVTRGVSVRNGAGPVSIGPNTWHCTNVVPVYFESTALGGSVVARQTRIGDGALVTDNTSALNSPAIDYSYQRPINWTVTSTPTALWTFGVANFTGGIIDVAVTGVHNGVSGFVASQKVAWLVDGSGVVTLTTLETVQHGSTTVGLTYTTSANTIVAKLAISSGTDIQAGKAQLEVAGHLTTLKVGA
jgi:hypothetical protein